MLLAAAATGGNATLEWLGALGGAAVFATAVWAVIRAILKQVNATEDNTQATRANTVAIANLDGKVTKLETTVAVQGERLTTQGREIGQLRDAVNRNGRH